MELRFVFNSDNNEKDAKLGKKIHQVDDKKEADEVFYEEHYQEIRSRCFQMLSLYFTFFSLAFIYVEKVVVILQQPVGNVRFFQISPGEYFIATLSISFYTGLVLCTPIILNQSLYFFLPSFTIFQKRTIFGLVCGSVTLFLLGLNFSYFILAPAAVKFFINYGSDIIEPIWSFRKYFSFTATLFFSTALVFQVPIVQIMLSLLGMVDPKKMLGNWKIVGFLSTIVGAIFTPSVDPTTQLLLSGALFLLYLGGGYASVLMTKAKLANSLLKTESIF